MDTRPTFSSRLFWLNSSKGTSLAMASQSLLRPCRMLGSAP